MLKFKRKKKNKQKVVIKKVEKQSKVKISASH